MQEVIAPQGIGGMPRTGGLPLFGWPMMLYAGTPVLIRPNSRHAAERKLEFLPRLSPEMRRVRLPGLALVESAPMRGDTSTGRP